MQTKKKYGCFLIVPLKYDEAFEPERLSEQFARYPLTTMDLNENIKAMLNASGDAAIGICYSVPAGKLWAEICQDSTVAGQNRCFVTAKDKSYSFTVGASYLYVFHTLVAFLCLRLSFDDMEALNTIYNPGYAENSAAFCWEDHDGEQHPFSLSESLSTFCAKVGFQKFFDGNASILLDAFTYTLALFPARFKTLEELRKITFNLHQMLPVESFHEDDSEEDVRYVYAVKNQEMASYRWGCCVSSQTVSYAVADASMDLDTEMEVQAADGLPLVALALYEKYTCLRFTELIAKIDKKHMKELKGLKTLMLKFQAFGTVTPSVVSRWHNVKQIYANLLEVNDIRDAIDDIKDKLDVLAEHQQELERSRNEKVINIITIFGIVSILASVQSIIQILSDGDPLIWVSTILTTVVLALAMIVTLRLHK